MDKTLGWILALITSAGPWLSRTWAWVSPLCGLLVASLLIQLGVIPSIPESQDETTVQWWRLGTLAGLPLVAFIVWLISTQVYLRTGRGTKVGLAYDGPKVNLADWHRTRLVLKDLFAGGQIKSRVSLRFVPLRATQVETRGDQYIRRYGFTVMLVLEAGGSKDQRKPFDKISLRIPANKEAKLYLTTYLQNALALLAGRSQGELLQIRDLHTMQAHMLRDLLLSFVATHCFINKDYEDASTILQTIDHSLSGLPPDKPPRAKIREFDALCCLEPLRFPISEIPSRDVLEQRVAIAERAMCYFDEYAIVYVGLARARFLLGDVDVAVELTEKAKTVIAELKKKNLRVSEKALATIYLNSGFLFFIQGRWYNAYESYAAMLSLEGYKADDWSTLVSFIDYVRDLDVYEGIAFLQVMYRKIAGKEVTDSLFHEADAWLNEDGSHKKLQDLLHKAYEARRHQEGKGDAHSRTKRGKEHGKGR